MGRRDHVTLVLKELHRLTIVFQAQVKALVYKALNHFWPQDLKHWLVPYESARWLWLLDGSLVQVVHLAEVHLVATAKVNLTMMTRPPPSQFAPNGNLTCWIPHYLQKGLQTLFGFANHYKILTVFSANIMFIFRDGSTARPTRWPLRALCQGTSEIRGPTSNTLGLLFFKYCLFVFLCCWKPPW